MKKLTLFKRILSALRPPQFPLDPPSPPTPEIPGMKVVPADSTVADSLRGVSPDTEHYNQHGLLVITTPNAVLTFPRSTSPAEVEAAVKSAMQDLAGYYFWAANTGRVVVNIGGEAPGLQFYVPPQPKGSDKKQ